MCGKCLTCMREWRRQQEATRDGAEQADDPDDEFDDEETFLNLDDVLEGAAKKRHPNSALAFLPSTPAQASQQVTVLCMHYVTLVTG